MLKVLRVSFALVLCLAASAALAAGKWDAPVTELGRKIIAITGPGTASLEVLNAISLSPDEVLIVRRAVAEQLRAGGLQIRDGAPTAIRLTLSENIRGFLWIAEVQQGSDTKTVMVSVPRLDATAGGSPAAITLRRNLLFAQEEQILDTAIVQTNNQRQLFVLTPSAVTIYRANGARWESVQSVSIPHEAYPRDLRGRLWAGRDGNWNAYLPGIQCSGPAQLQQPMSCHDSDDPWRLEENTKAFYNSSRNYFTGAVVPAMSKPFPPFYSAALAKRGKSDVWVYTGVDGQVQTFDGTTVRTLHSTRDWGSDLAAVHSGCGLDSQLLVTSAAEDSTNDSLRAFELNDRESISVSAPLVFDGTITALWTTTEGDSAIAVIRTATGGYEAYSVTVVCNQ